MEKIVIDIETRDADEAALNIERRFVKPHANTKDTDKQRKQVQERSQKIIENAALLDASPIICIGLKTPTITVQFSTYPDGGLSDYPNDTVLLYKNENLLLESFRQWIDGHGEVAFIGHNVESRKDVKGFDLPHLRFRYASYGLPIPNALDPLRTRSVDTMLLFWKSSRIATPFVSLEEVAIRLGIIDYALNFPGERVPLLWKEGRIKEILLKNQYDLLLTEQIYYRLSV